MTAKRKRMKRRRKGKERRKRGENAETGEKRGDRDNPSEFGRDPNMLPGGVQTVAQRNRSSGRWCCVKEERCVDITAGNNNNTAPNRQLRHCQHCDNTTLLLHATPPSTGTIPLSNSLNASRQHIRISPKFT